MRAPYEFASATFLPFQLSNKFGLRLAAVMAVLLTLLYGLLIAFLAPAFMDFVALMETSAANPNDPAILSGIFNFYGQLFVKGLIPMLLIGVLFVSAETAFHNKVQNDVDHGAFPLRLGGREGRTFVAMLCAYLLLYAALLVGMVVMFVIALLFGGLGGLIGSEAGAAGGAIIAVFFGYILMYGLMIFVGIRLAPAASMTARHNKIHVFKALEASKGRFWWMFLSYVVIYFIMVFLFYLLMFIAMFVVMSGLPFDQMSSGANVDPNEIWAGLMSPGRIITYAILGFILSFVMAFSYMAFWGVGSYVTKINYTEAPDTTFA